MKKYNRLIYLHDAVLGLIPKRYYGYPYNWTGLLHAADDVLIYDDDGKHRQKAWECRNLAIDNMTN